MPQKKEFDEGDNAPYDDDLKAEGSLSLEDPFSSKKPVKTKGYISKLPFITWTLVSIIGIVFCLVHSHQDAFWQWTGDTTADAQSLQAKVVVSLFSAIIGGCVVALLSKTLVSASFVLLRYRGASLSHLATLIEGYNPSRIPTVVVGGGWVSSILIILIIAASAVTKQLAIISMGVDFVATNSTKVSYTKNYTNCLAPLGPSNFYFIQSAVTFQTFSAILNPNSSFTNEHYDTSIPAGLTGHSQFERVLPYAEASCIPFNSSKDFYLNGTPTVDFTTYTWQVSTTLPFTISADDLWINCTIKAGYANANSTCNGTKCETVRTSENITPFEERGNGLPPFLRRFFSKFAPGGTSGNNLIVTWLLGGDILTDAYSRNSDIPNPTVEFIENRAALLGTVMARVVCDRNPDNDDEDYRLPGSPITSSYIDHSYYQYKVLWAWPFYLLAGCIFLLWVLCMMAMWIAPESRVLSTDWLLHQYIARHQDGYLSNQQLLQAHHCAKYQVFDENAHGDVGNIAISRVESRKLDKYDRVSRHKQYYSD
ncbi:hypothetical protein V8B55DRAFT_1572026 [Mucor lusitanicus]|uniref:Uncharacterized protein n=1 Tax=Mucor lusitanicus CBS 277.49 TaxID=747725 RepID=A0A168PLF1_MUCCL|nr:hypothetical protein MUCCIDRAFT_158146 [Mucor lusitanicus CBS 277.49]